MSFGAFLCLGYAVTMYQRRAAGKPTGPEVRKKPSNFALDPRQAEQFLEQVRRLTQDADETPDDSWRKALGARLESASDEAASVLAAGSGLMEANAQVRAELTVAESQIRELQERLAFREGDDPLNGVAGPRGLEGEVKRRFAEWKRRGTPFCLLRLKADRLRGPEGEQSDEPDGGLLGELAGVLFGTLRATDMLARCDEEGFAAVLPGSTAMEAMQAVERLRAAVGGGCLEADGRPVGVTVSVGMAEVSAEDDAEKLAGRAEAALRRAVDAGGNRGCWHNGTACEPIETVVRSSRRFAMETVQRIAPFDDEKLEPTRFREVLCKDMSGNGFSYLAAERPHHTRLVVELGSRDNPTHLLAVVKNCRSVGTESDPMYRVGCQFVDRLRGSDRAV